MNNQWERFKGGPNKPKQERLHVTLNRAGVIMLNRLMFQMLGSPAAVVFFYNQRGSSIGLLPANPQLDDAFPVINRASAWFINAAPFCRNYGLAPRTGTQAFLEPEIDNDGMLRLDTSKTIKVSHGPRKRRTKLEILTESCA